ncbi:Wzz/FepE/Etk N-terminal domain-containing protein [Flavobacterium sp. W21_SRS_FM6]|uniref:Wzz/FepE/Etk N-terminal domain-containing protein n=1 Tax=Flavobacterium sp. W21_SRS_FM6 TaxID=3240268 RepID=UPI003F8E1ADE
MTDNNLNEVNKDNIRYVMITPENLQNSDADNDEIDFRKLWNVIWSGKWIIIGVTAIFTIASIFYALSLPNIYKSEALLAPANSEQQGGLGALASQFGGLASLAGVNLGGAKADKTDMAIEILKSREFFSQFVDRHNILPDLMAVKEWDRINNSVIYDTEIYLPKSDEWVRQVKPPRQIKPSMQEAIETFKNLLNLAKDKETSMVNISIQHYSPYIAKQWVDWLIRDINLNMKSRDKQEAEKSIAYLQSQIEKTTITEHKTLLYQLIEEQTKTLMFAEVRDEYVFKTIDSALVPELKAKPKRALIVVLGVLLGGMVAVMIVLIRYFASNKTTNGDR